ncbi:Chaperone protein ClpB2 [Hibiscus syriacus]|uniref:Chaperone protein ClpB2 n=1 Tax=Hibiscus syriacus TaxID=106335 RepID=A0A6A2ZSF8_HIBSY|nr:Chaperone protein ClpB2 [Hibiscus syriacus]
MTFSTGIPVSKLQQSEREKLLYLEEVLHKRVVGQDPAVRSVAEAIQRSRAGLSDPRRPIASFMFMGPTGVGKTELAKALASYLFNTEEALVRIDMSEYMEKHAVSRLIGAPPAHGDVFNAFLQILEDGRVTDSQGRTVSFTNTVIIMTSNVGSQYILNSDEDTPKDLTYETIKQRVMEAARALERVQARIADRKIKLQVTDSAVQLLGNLVYDPNYGARPVKRVIQQNIENELAKGILRGEFKDEDTILVDTELTAFANGQLPQQKLIFKKLDNDSNTQSTGTEEALSSTV